MLLRTMFYDKPCTNIALLNFSYSVLFKKTADFKFKMCCQIFKTTDYLYSPNWHGSFIVFYIKVTIFINNSSQTEIDNFYLVYVSQHNISSC